MSDFHAIQTFLEISIVILIVIGFVYEDKIIELETSIKKLLIHKIKNHKKQVSNKF